MSLSAAQMSVRSAHTSLESRRYDSASDNLDRAQQFLAGLPDDDTAAIHAEIASLRAAVDEAVTAEKAERMIRAAKMQLGRVASEVESGYDADYVLASTLAKAGEFLAEVPSRFTVDIRAEIARWRDRITGYAPVPAPAPEVAKVESRWTAVEQSIAGWDTDTFEINESFPFRAPELRRTRAALRETGWMLDDSSLREIRAALPDHSAVVTVFENAERIQEAAFAQLARAYHQVLDHAEHLDTPIRPEDRGRPVLFMNDTEATFTGTSHHAGLVSRARLLHERFEAEYAAIIQARQELWDRLVPEADAAWSSIVESAGAREVDPTAADAEGQVVLLRGVHNRSGWEWGGFSFAMSWDGTPIAGDYAPNVLAALEHAWYELQFSHAATADGPAVDDRLEWDVIAEVTGRGRITGRTTIIRRDQYGLEIGREEQWLPVDGVVLSVIGLRAGPVATGPGHDWKPSA